MARPTFVVEEGVLKVNGKLILVPRDRQFGGIVVMCAIDDAGNIVPLACDADGKLKVETTPAT